MRKRFHRTKKVMVGGDAATPHTDEKYVNVSLFVLSAANQSLRYPPLPVLTVGVGSQCMRFVAQDVQEFLTLIDGVREFVVDNMDEMSHKGAQELRKYLDAEEEKYNKLKELNNR